MMDAQRLTDPDRSHQEPAPAGAGRLVGRDAELRLVRPLIAGLQSGSGGVVTLAGDPGVGKTRLAQELAAQAPLHGATVHWGRCAESEGMPAYWPWIQILRAWLASHDDADLRHDLGSGAPALAQVVPEVGERLPNLPALPAAPPDQARFRIFDSVASWLQRATSRQPLVLVLDDAHWADAASLRLLEFVAPRLHELPLLVVVTYRDFEIYARPELREALDALYRQPAHVAIELRGWDAAGVAQAVERIVGAAPAPGVAAAIHERTEGNPFFVIETVRLLAAEGALPDGSPNAPRQIPASVREAIRRRLAALSEPCRELLATAAIIGRDFTLPVVAGAAGQPVEQVVDLLDEAAAAHIVQPPDAAGQARFAHVLISETLAAGLGAARRMRLHAAVAAALEQLDAGPVDDIAYHYRQAAVLGHAPRAIDHSIAAAERAMAQAAWETAIDHYRHALELFAYLHPPDPARRCELLLTIGEAHNAAAGLLGSRAARAAFEQAAQLARQMNASVQFARAALGFGGVNALRAAGGVRQVDLLGEALAILDPADSPLKARVLARLATSLTDRALGHRRDLPRARDLSDAAVAMARRLDDSPTLINALVMWHIAHSSPDDIAARLDATAEAIRLADASGDREFFAWAHDLRCNDLLELGRLDQFEDGLMILRSAATELRLPGMTWSVLNREAMLAQSAGRYDHAEEMIARMYAERPATDRGSFLKLVFLRREQGRLAEIEDTVRAYYSASASLYDLAFILILDIDANRLDAARATLDRVPIDRYERLDRDAVWLLTLALHAEASHALDDRDRAATLYTLLSPYADRNVGATGNLFLGAAARFLGLLAATRRDWDIAERHFRHAIAINTRLGMLPYAAHARYACAETLARRGHSADHDAIRDLLAQALATATELGMEPLRARVHALSDTLDPAPSRPAISNRERDVLRLLVEGRSNQEIAATLAISPHTAATHVTNILNKLGLDSRAAAAAWAVRHGVA
jgi:DNA-binding CsgD family transcriptional regulator